MKLDKQRVFSLFIGIMMITWVVGIAMSSTIQSSQQGLIIQNVYDRVLTANEKITILRSGRVLIEHLYTGTHESLEKKAAYENFVARFKDFVVLETVEVEQENQTVDQMINPNGDIIPMDNVSAGQLVDVFCDNTLFQPKECLLRSI